MEAILLLTSFLLVLILPTAFLVTAYINHTKGVKASEIFIRLLAAFAGYAVITSIVFWFMFILVFAGAHSTPPGMSLDAKGKVFYLLIVSSYIVIGWLLCSLVKGRLMRFWHSLKRDN